MRELENYVELEMIFGMFGYVVKFILNFSELNVFIRDFKISDKWNWILEVKQLFNNVKKVFFLIKVLRYFDIN